MGNLKPVIREMLDRARSAPDIPQRLAIQGTVAWLTMEITQQYDGQVILALGQPNEWPTTVDWRRVLYAWPEPVPVEGTVYATRKEGRLYRSVLRWPRPVGLET